MNHDQKLTQLYPTKVLTKGMLFQVVFISTVVDLRLSYIQKESPRDAS